MTALNAQGTLATRCDWRGLEYEDLVTGNLTVHAFYVKYLLPIYFDVQCMERAS